MIKLTSPTTDLSSIIVMGTYIAYGNDFGAYYDLSGARLFQKIKQDYEAKGFLGVFEDFEHDKINDYFKEDDSEYENQFIENEADFIKPTIPMCDLEHYYEKCHTNEDPIVRMLVALNGFYLDELVNDPDYRVRIGVVNTRKQPYMNTLTADTNKEVRIAVAKTGNRAVLDMLVEQGDLERDMETLITIIHNHKQSFAEQYAHHELQPLRMAAAQTLSEELILSTEMYKDECPKIRAVILSRGYVFDILKDDPSDEVKYAIEHFEIPF